MSKRQKTVPKKILATESLKSTRPYGLTDEDLLLFEKMQITQFPKAPALNKESDKILFTKRTNQICSESVYDKKTRSTKIKKITTLLYNYIIYNYNQTKTVIIDIPDSFQFTLKVFITLNGFFDDIISNIIDINEVNKQKLNVYFKSYFIYLTQLVPNTRRVNQGPNSLILTRSEKKELQNLFIPNPEPTRIDFSQWNSSTSNEPYSFPPLQNPVQYMNVGLGFDDLTDTPSDYLTQKIIHLIKRRDCIITVPNFKKLNNFYKKEFIINSHLLKLSKDDIHNLIEKFVNLFPNEVCTYLYQVF
jgi:hypothetical protein